MRIYKNGKWHKGCDSCGEFIEDCVCEKVNQKKKEIPSEQSKHSKERK